MENSELMNPVFWILTPDFCLLYELRLFNSKLKTENLQLKTLDQKCRRKDLP